MSSNKDLAQVARSLSMGKSPELSETANQFASAIFMAIARVFEEADKLNQSTLQERE